MTDEVFIQVHWEHFPLLGTPNFWSSVFMTVYCESDFSVLNSPLNVFTIKFPLEKFVQRGNKFTHMNILKPYTLKNLLFSEFRVYLLIFP